MNRLLYNYVHVIDRNDYLGLKLTLHTDMLYTVLIDEPFSSTDYKVLYKINLPKRIVFEFDSMCNDRFKYGK